MNGSCKVALILVVLISVAAFIMPSSAQLASSSGSSFGTSGSSFSSFSGSSLSGYGGWGGFSVLGGPTELGVGRIGVWGHGWGGGLSSAFVAQSVLSRLNGIGYYFGYRPPFIQTPIAPATALVPEKGIGNAAISSEKGISS